jgi:nitroimidazol reductase NimA-like FMN-containing flavoprotein (pyridoxamine 5'-phosphate oxidase superfamily)
MIGELATPQIEELLKSEVMGRIGCHHAGTTYIVPTSYAYDGTHIYVHTHEGMKVEMMRKNPAVCFQVDNMRDMANWQSVIAWGTYEELPPGEDRTTAIQALQSRQLPIVSSITTHLGAAWPFSSDSDKDLEGIVFRIALNEKTGRFESTSYSR